MKLIIKYESHFIVFINSKRVTRIELATSAWKAEVIPFNYTRTNISFDLLPLKTNEIFTI